MDIKNYISSGILESYILGLATEQEVKEVECLSTIYPEIKDHLLSLDQNAIAITDRYKIDPPADVKDKLFSQLDREFTHSIAPKTDKKKPAGKSRTMSPLWAAASVVLLAACTYFFMQNKQLNKTIEQQITTIEQNQQQLADIEKEAAQSSQKAELVTAPTTKHIALASTANNKVSLADVYWNAEEKTFLLTNNLPVAPSGKQYQFWAIVDGQPKDMGVIPLQANADYVNDIRFATVDAFAITLEQKGGSPTPNLDQLKAIGKIT